MSVPPPVARALPTAKARNSVSSEKPALVKLAGQLADRGDGVRQRSERRLEVGGGFRRRLGADASGRDVHEPSAVHRRGVDPHGLASEDNIHGMIRVLRDSRLPGEVVGGAQRHDAERDVASVEPVDHLVERPVAPARDHDIGPAVGRVRGEVDAVPRLPRHADVHRMAALTDPRHDVPQLGQVGAPTVHDEGQVLSRGHRIDRVSERRTPARRAARL
jgi:hypothetical protein